MFSQPWLLLLIKKICSDIHRMICLKYLRCSANGLLLILTLFRRQPASVTHVVPQTVGFCHSRCSAGSQLLTLTLFRRQSASDTYIVPQKRCSEMRQGALKKSYLHGAFASSSYEKNCSELLTFKHTGFQMSNTISGVLVIPTKYK